MSSDLAIRVSNVSKNYLMFDKPEDRLKQMIMPKVNRLLGREPVKYYRDFAAVNEVSLEVGRGETVGIIGRNGSGKSTLLQMICGTLQPSSGSVEVNGRVAALLELGSGFNPDFTGRENVYINAAILGLSREETEQRFEQIAAFADIGMFIEHPVKTYSSGMYVRLAFAVATNVDPDILVVDEALAVGDEAFQRKCFARIDEIKNRGGTILFVSHGAQTIVQLCDRAILMDRGENILEGRPKTVTNQYQRYLNLSGNEAETVRENIKAMDGWAEPAPAQVTEVKGVRAPATASSTDQAWFDTGLVSESRVEYESKGAQISNIRILDDSGKPVNNLLLNNKYHFAYDVTLEKDADYVAFAMLVKTIQGVELAGQASHPAGQGLSCAAGETISVSLPFVCSFLSGAYVCNCGVYINGAGRFEQLHRVLDAIMFRVIPTDPAYSRMGLVDACPGNEPVVLERRRVRQSA